jgi:hypothetical protein
MNNIEDYIHQPRITINQEIKIKNNNKKNNFMILLNSNDISLPNFTSYIAFTVHFFIFSNYLNKE